MALIEIDGLPFLKKHGGDFPWRTVKQPEGKCLNYKNYYEQC